MSIRNGIHTGQDAREDRQAIMLAATVERLRTELEELRSAMRDHTVVEQAKGLLAERLSCDVDAAYEHLLQLAHDTGVNASEAAALLFGVTLPSGTGDGGQARVGPTVFDPATYLREMATPNGSAVAQRPAAGDPAAVDLPAALAARRHLAAAAFASARSVDELARHLCEDALGWLDARSVLLATVEPDGALRVAGSHALPAHVVSAWSRIPPHTEVALVRAVATALPVWPPQGSEHTVGGAAGLSGARASVPMIISGRVFAAAEIIWPEEKVLDEEQRRYVTAVVASCGQRLHDLALDGVVPGTATNRDAPWLRAVIEAIPGPAALLSPIRDDLGRVIDFHVDACNGDTTDKLGRTPGELIGARLVETYPGLALSGLFDAYVHVLETGAPLREGPRNYSTLLDGRLFPATMTVRACRIGDGLLVSWRFHDDPEDLAVQLDQAQRLGNLGWSAWDLSTDEIKWSDQLYVIFGTDPAAGPFTRDQLAEHVLPEDLPIAENLMRTLLERREPADREFRIRRGEEIRHLRVMAEPVLDPHGEPAALRSVYQDVTQRCRAEHALAASRQQLERQRRRIAEERHIALELQRAIMPLPRNPVELPGLMTAFRYLPAESDTRVGGDWYETTALADDGVFLAIGDVSGHGLPAAAAMARLRNALSGLAFTGAPPDQLLAWLNQLLFHRATSLTASAIAARFDPDTRTLLWAQAGHPPPMLVRQGKTEMLDPPEGVLLGATQDAVFTAATTELSPGDLLLLYTDGLIERRDRDLCDGLTRLSEVAAQCEGTDPDRDIDHVLRALGATNPDDDTCVVAVRVL